MYTLALTFKHTHISTFTHICAFTQPHSCIQFLNHSQLCIPALSQAHTCVCMLAHAHTHACSNILSLSSQLQAATFKTHMLSPTHLYLLPFSNLTLWSRIDPDELLIANISSSLLYLEIADWFQSFLLSDQDWSLATYRAQLDSGLAKYLSFSRMRSTRQLSLSKVQST